MTGQWFYDNRLCPNNLNFWSFLESGSSQVNLWNTKYYWCLENVFENLKQDSNLWKKFFKWFLATNISGAFGFSYINRDEIFIVRNIFSSYFEICLDENNQRKILEKFATHRHRYLDKVFQKLWNAANVLFYCMHYYLYVFSPLSITYYGFNLVIKYKWKSKKWPSFNLRLNLC